MGKYCSVYGCGSSSRYNKDLQFHRFPRDERCQSWVKACKRPSLKDKDKDKLYNKHVCGLHFPKWMYVKTKLKSAAIPVLHLPPTLNDHTWEQTESPGIKITNVTSLSTAAHTSDVMSDSDTKISTEKLTEDPPRKRKIKNKTTRCFKKRKFIDDTKSTGITPQQFIHGCNKFLSPNLSKIVKTQVRSQPHPNNRYSNEFKQFCLNIYYSSPHAYKFLSKILRLPSKRILATSVIPVGTKITDYIWDVLSQAVQQLSPSERECTFCMSVMRLKSSLFYDNVSDKIVGLHDIDDFQSSYAAGYVFTVMLRGILKDWKQLVGYAFIITDKILGESLEEWIVSTIKRLFALGFKIRAVVSDQGSDFINLAKRRGISKQKPYFEIEGRKIYYIFDVPHLMKSVRNNLIKYDFVFNGKTASWDDIYECYQLDKQKDFRLAPKLTDAHISPKNFQKNSVRLAIQVFSKSVKVAIETYTRAGELNPRDGTFKFIGIMDKLFDLLNSHDPFSLNLDGKLFKEYENRFDLLNFSQDQDNKQRSVLLKAQKIMRCLKVKQKDGKDITTKIKFINAFHVTINAIMQLYDDLKKESGSDEFHLLTRRLNNESLENSFDMIRQSAGNKKPTCIQFERAFRKLFLCQSFKLFTKNCINDFDDVFSQYNDFTKSKSIFTRTVSTNFDIPELNGFLYICGYIFRRCIEKHKCISTVNYSTSYSAAPTTNNAYVRKRTYIELPPSDFVRYCRVLEEHFKQLFRSFVGKNILENLYKILNKISFKSRPCPCFPKSFMIRLFIRMRLHWTVKYNNSKLITSRNNISRNYVALQHV